MRIGGATGVGTDVGNGGRTGEGMAALWVMGWTGGSGADGVSIVASPSRSNRGASRNRYSDYGQADNSNRFNHLSTGIP